MSPINPRNSDSTPAKRAPENRRPPPWAALPTEPSPGAAGPVLCISTPTSKPYIYIYNVYICMPCHTQQGLDIVETKAGPIDGGPRSVFRVVAMRLGG